MNQKIPHLSGLIAATYTAFSSDGSLNLEEIERQAAVLIKDRVAGAFICGTTGEGLSLTSRERMLVAKRWRTAVSPGALKIIVHVGHNSLEEAIALAKHAAEIGADAVSVSAPNFFKPSSVDDLLSFCVPVARAAQGLPFYYYEIPAMTGVHLSMVEFLEKGGRLIPNLAWIKFSSTDLAVLQECRVMENERYNLLFGCDEMLLAALALGIRGAIGSTFNYAAPLYHRLIAAFETGNLTGARELQLRSVEMIKVLQPYGVLAAGKAVMSCRGVECGPVRPPLRQLGESQRDELLAKIKKANFVTQYLESDTSSLILEARGHIQ
jgi:N-acetylneuraminate lyase